MDLRNKGGSHSSSQSSVDENNNLQANKPIALPMHSRQQAVVSIESDVSSLATIEQKFH